MVRWIVFFALWTIALGAFGDELLLEGIREEPENSLQGLPRPKPGMPKKNVLEIFGQPKHRSGPVGHPPISRWTYDKFVVVFEGDRVINSVIKKQRPTAP